MPLPRPARPHSDDVPTAPGMILPNLPGVLPLEVRTRAMQAGLPRRQLVFTAIFEAGIAFDVE
jgi:hypothetical protein